MTAPYTIRDLMDEVSAVIAQDTDLKELDHAIEPGSAPLPDAHKGFSVQINTPGQERERRGQSGGSLRLRHRLTVRLGMKLYGSRANHAETQRTLADHSESVIRRIIGGDFGPDLCDIQRLFISNIETKNRPRGWLVRTLTFDLVAEFALA